MTNWSVEQASDTYSIPHWSDGYFGINDAGQLVAHPHGKPGDGQSGQGSDIAPGIALGDVLADLAKQGMRAPVLLRFTDILHDRVARMEQAFAKAMAADGYQGDYCAAYPIKVNQQRRVIEEILVGGHAGLEAGSKPELMIVLSLSKAGGTIICNGYKDREYIRLALIGCAMGYDLHIVIEKPSELELVLQESEALGITPSLGVRVRLASLGKGKWQNTGGEKSKFGLSAQQLLALLATLRDADKLHTLNLLHVHLGSQIANIQDIQRGLREISRYYSELHAAGARIKHVDVGGGLGIDYEGTRSRSYCSVNYSLQEYANNVVHSLWEGCDAAGLPHPNIITESGRAMTAHHAVLVTEVIATENIPDGLPDGHIEDHPVMVINDLVKINNKANLKESPLEIYHDVVHAMQTVHEQYIHGLLTLEQRAYAEQLYYASCRKVLPRLDAGRRAHRDVLDALNEKLAGKAFCNMSVFQSLPDVWAIDQVFPIVPLSRLNERPDQRMVVADITCDSDGRIDHYVDSEGVESTLPMHYIHDNESYLLGIFLVGAYQEILGDRHNLFGDTHSVNVELDGQGGYRVFGKQQGEGVDSVLRHVDFDATVLEQRLRERLAVVQSEQGSERYEQFMGILSAGLTGYTYLEK